jgi:hypothetical protein
MFLKRFVQLPYCEEEIFAHLQLTLFERKLGIFSREVTAIHDHNFRFRFGESPVSTTARA